jgi:hypothetical protein
LQLAGEPLDCGWRRLRLQARRRFGILVPAGANVRVRRAFSTMDPVVRDYWYVRVNEGMPVWHQKPAIALSLMGVPVAGRRCIAVSLPGR